MRLERLLIHRCTLINPGQVVGKDAYNRDIIEDVPTPNVHCRIDQIKRRMSNDSNGVDIIVENVLFLSASEQINDAMTIKDIVDKDGNSVLSGIFKVDNINPIHGRIRLHHYEVTLKKAGD
ncbi:hypothetical protein J1P26_21815 [Neobacillus sp. MM2021_6]|uniref:hypothetical protein n=1 Tax=Bacillaceae TaxID=186817 RepID=UPI001409CBD6|nr:MULTISPECIES: hypothetical protein [Bacillaceae]MBO0962344.1 hypothetical protein [Neobacillus sp. MM2021_6]NHC20827.1 hypothetical protein [Bacillus sp. MM2020_4]